jgi:hypothetical protein
MLDRSKHCAGAISLAIAGTMSCNPIALNRAVSIRVKSARVAGAGYSVGFNDLANKGTGIFEAGNMALCGRPQNSAFESNRRDMNLRAVIATTHRISPRRLSCRFRWYSTLHIQQAGVAQFASSYKSKNREPHSKLDDKITMNRRTATFRPSADSQDVAIARQIVMKQALLCVSNWRSDEKRLPSD